MSKPLDEIRAVLRTLPEAEAEPATRAMAAASAAGADSLHMDIAGWLAGWQRRWPPRVQHPRLALFATAHGLAAATLPALLAEIDEIVGADGPVVAACARADTDLRLYEMALSQPTADIRVGPALDEAQTAHAVAYGMTIVEPGLDLLVLAALGDGAVAAARVLSTAIDADDADPLALLGARGGPDLAAIAGAIVAARMAGTPVLLDGVAAETVGALLARIDPRAVAHCRNAAALVGHEGAPGEIGAAAIEVVRDAVPA